VQARHGGLRRRSQSLNLGREGSSANHRRKLRLRSSLSRIAPSPSKRKSHPTGEPFGRVNPFPVWTPESTGSA